MNKLNIVIVGGGNVGITIAKKLISENHNITIIDNNKQVLKYLKKDLDALSIEGDAVNIEILKKVDIKKAALFLAVTNDDNTNILSCIIAKKINQSLITVARIQNAYFYFNDNILSYEDFSINMMIDPKLLSINKILTLIENNGAIEIVKYADNKVQLVGLKIDEDFEHLGVPLKDIGNIDEDFNKVRIVAIYRNEKIIIPKGNNKLLTNDKTYIIGKVVVIQKIMKKYFDDRIKLKNIVIVGGNQLSKELSGKLQEQGKNVTIIEEDIKKCEELSRETNKIKIINGSGTDESILNEVQVEKSCFICVTNDDEYNMISAVSAKNYKASKTICMIHNIALLKMVNAMASIDAVFSPNILTVGEILSYCRSGNISSVSTFSEINAETIDLTITEKIPILDIPLKNVSFPTGMIIGVIIRGDEVIVPTGDDILLLNDKLILFILPEAVSEVEKFFSKRFFWRFK